MASLATSILTNTASLIRPIVEAELAANPQASEQEVEAKVITWANHQLGSGFAGSLVKPIADAVIELYLPGIYEAAVKQALGTADGGAVIAAQGAASQEAAATPSASFPVVSANADGTPSVAS